MNDGVPQVALAAIVGREHDIERELFGSDAVQILDAGGRQGLLAHPQGRNMLSGGLWTGFLQKIDHFG